MQVDFNVVSRIATLKDHPGWVELGKRIDEERERYAKALAKTMLVTGRPPESEAMSFEYKRGYLAGMRDLTRYPEAALKQLAKERAKQEEESADS